MCNYLVEVLDGKNSRYVRPIQSVIIDFDKLETEDEVYRIASIISGSICKDIYVIFSSQKVPREEYRDSSQIVNALKLIHLLESAEKKTIVAFCSSDLLIFKAAGASSCASGKFFNLRRFSPSRFEDANGGGGQLPYWFEEGLLAFLRQADILRIQQHDLGRILKTNGTNNYWSEKILKQLKSSPKKAWVSLGWRQYLAWFCDAERRLTEYRIEDIVENLKAADKNWAMLDSGNVFLEERKNNGEWIRAWLQAITDLSEFVA